MPMRPMSASPFRELPSVNDVLQAPAIQALTADGTLGQITKTWLSDKVSAPVLQ